MRPKNINCRIEIENDQVFFNLLQGRKLLDRHGFPLDRDLSQKLLVFLDKFLEKNKLEVRDVKSFKFSGGAPKSYTSYRIIHAMISALNLSSKSY